MSGVVHVGGGVVQVPPLHVPEEQMFPQLPQSFGSVDRSTHPPEHSVVPASQPGAGAVQVPPWQVPEAHTLPQLPQLVALVPRSTQLPLQMAIPASHPPVVPVS